MPQKGISPIIAAVVLIAITLAIAGVLSFWVSSFVSGQTQGISAAAECAGALQLETSPPSMTYSNGNFIIILVNGHRSLTVQNVSAIMTYAGGALTENPLNTDLPPNSVISRNVTLPTKPQKVRLKSANCPLTPNFDVP